MQYRSFNTQDDYKELSLGNRGVVAASDSPFFEATPTCLRVSTQLRALEWTPYATFEAKPQGS